MPGEQVVGGEGYDAVERRGHIGEVEARDLAAALRDIYCVLFPVNVGVGTHTFHHGKQLGVAAEEDMQAQLDRPAFGIPGRDFAAQHGALLRSRTRTPRICQVCGCCQTGQATANLLRLS